MLGNFIGPSNARGATWEFLAARVDQYSNSFHLALPPSGPPAGHRLRRETDAIRYFSWLSPLEIAAHARADVLTELVNPYIAITV